jgi:hypothetical protein
MTTFEAITKQIAKEIYLNNFRQVTIDFVQERVEELFNPDDPLTSETVGAVAYEAEILLEAMNPKFERDIDLLTRLQKALHNWSEDIRATNLTLGLPPTS